MRPASILFLFPNEFFGPEMTVFAQVIRHLDLSRFQVHLAVDQTAEGSLDVDESKIRVTRMAFGCGLREAGLQGFHSAARLPWIVLNLVRYLRKERIQVIHCSSTPRAALIARTAAYLTGARLVVHYHVIPGRYGGPRGLVEKLIMETADRAVATSRFIAAELSRRGVPDQRLRVVENGVNLTRFRPGISGSAIRSDYGIPTEAPVVLELARIIQQKRQEDVVRAFAIARREVPDLRCLLVGWEDPRYDGPFENYRAELEHIAECEGVADSLIIAAARPDAPELITAADIVVLPSENEAWGLVVTEAMACGKPVIGAHSGGIPEQIIDGETGFLVPPRSPRGLAKRMVLLAQCAELRKRMGRAARARAEHHFSETQLGERFSKIYEELLPRETLHEAPQAAAI